MSHYFKKILVICVVTISVFIGLFLYFTLNNRYESVSIEEAYNNNLITLQELEEIYNKYDLGEKIELDKDVEKKIKKSYIKRFDIKMEYEDVFINYYGKCNDYYILSISNNKINNPTVEKAVTIGDFEFYYTGEMIELWYKK